MELSEIVSHFTAIGLVITIVSFLAYVFAPNPVFIGLFVLGIIFMVGGYTHVVLLNKRTEAYIDDKLLELDERGYIMSLDDSYVPYQDEATIEILE